MPTMSMNILWEDLPNGINWSTASMGESIATLALGDTTMETNSSN